MFNKKVAEKKSVKEEVKEEVKKLAPVCNTCGKEPTYQNNDGDFYCCLACETNN